MATITMQGIADLAGVKRPVVSMWRKRFADSGNPFPAPLDNAKLKFDATEVGQWLRGTGHGNNPDAHLETLCTLLLLSTHNRTSTPQAPSSFLVNCVGNQSRPCRHK